jgi:hypothetical protein
MTTRIKKINTTRLTKPKVNGYAVHRCSNFFYKRLLESEHPFMVRWFAAFEGTGLCDDVVNIIAGYCFYRTTFPKVSLLTEAQDLSYFNYISGYVSRNDIDSDKLLSMTIWSDLRYKLSTLSRYDDEFEKLSLPFLQQLFRKDYHTIFKWCCKYLQIDFPNHHCFNVDGMFSEHRYNTVMPIVVAAFMNKYNNVKMKKINDIAKKLKVGNLYDDEFEKFTCFKNTFINIIIMMIILMKVF